MDPEVRAEAIRSVRELLSTMVVSDEAGEAQWAIAERLRGEGWQVQQEVRVPVRGDGSSGRVDVVASRGEISVAIECDRRTPRRKSVVKLRTRNWIRVIALRDPDPDFHLQVPDDLVVIGLRCTEFNGWGEGDSQA